MSIPSKAAGIISLVSSVRDIHKTSVIMAEEYQRKACADGIISKSIGTQKTNFLSYKDTERKKWLMQNSSILNVVRETIGCVKGYLTGVKNGVLRYLPKFILSALSIIPNKNMKIFSSGGILADKHNVVANIFAVALGITELSDYIVNGTNYGTKTDYLK